MEHKKILNYVVVSGKLDQFEMPLNSITQDLNECNKDIILNQQQQDYALQQINLNKLIISFLSPFLQLEVDKEYPPIKLNERNKMRYLFKYVSQYPTTILKNEPFLLTSHNKEKIVAIINNKEKNVLENKQYLDKLQSDITELNLKYDVISKINDELVNHNKVSSITFKMQYYINLGYVLQGGFYTRDGIGYQAIVKYEE